MRTYVHHGNGIASAWSRKIAVVIDRRATLCVPITVLPCKSALWHSWLSYEGSVRSGSIVLVSAVGLDNVVDVLVSLVVSPRLLFPPAAIAHQMGSVSIVDQQSDPITPRPAQLHPMPTIKSEPSKRVNALH